MFISIAYMFTLSHFIGRAASVSYKRKKSLVFDPKMDFLDLDLHCICRSGYHQVRNVDFFFFTTEFPVFEYISSCASVKYTHPTVVVFSYTDVFKGL